MFDSFALKAPSSRRSALSVSQAEGSRHIALCAVLLVEPAMTPRSDREQRLSAANYSVTVVREVREMLHLRFEETLFLAVLNDLLGPSALRAAAESVRRQWPLAKILVVGCATPTLEDFLYDEAISHRQDGTGLLAMIQTLAPRDITESDPTKGLPPTTDRALAERDLPGGIYRMRAAG